MDLDPFRVFGDLTAFQRSSALRAAIQIDLFTRIVEGTEDVEGLAARTGASSRGVRILCDYLTVAGYLEKDGHRYRATEESAAFLSAASPSYIGSAVHFLQSRTMLDAFEGLPDAVRTGATALGEHGSVEPDHPVWVEFARSMAPMIAPVSELFANALEADAAGPWKVLDVAAGHGLFGIAVARRNPQAEIFAVDWGSVLAVAEENARAAGVIDRWEMIPGDAFDVDFGGGYDRVLLPNILHHFDEQGCAALLERARESLAPGGLVAAVEFVPDENRVTPGPAAAFALVMLATTPSGDAYTPGDYERIGRAAGFSRVEVRDLLPTPQRAVFFHP